MNNNIISSFSTYCVILSMHLHGNSLEYFFYFKGIPFRVHSPDVINSPLWSPPPPQAPGNILGVQGFEWFWAQWNQGVWGWCVGYLQLPRLPQIPRSPSMDPKLITTHDTGEVGFLQNIFIQIATRGGWVPWKHFHQDRDPIWPQNGPK